MKHACKSSMQLSEEDQTKKIMFLQGKVVAVRSTGVLEGVKIFSIVKNCRLINKSPFCKKIIIGSYLSFAYSNLK